MTSRRRPTSPPATAPLPLPDYDDILSEILLRIPPQPSSLLRAAAVCKRWRRLVTDLHFFRRFRARRRTPPLLGFFLDDGSFVSTQDPPDRDSAARFCSGAPKGWEVVGCRHGLVLCRKWGKEYLVFDPMSGDRSDILIAQSGLPVLLTVAVVAIPGSISRLSFRLVVVSADYAMKRVSASVYSSDSGVWGNCNVKQLRVPAGFIHYPGTLVGNAIYWLDDRGWILQYDLERQRLAITYLPAHIEASYDFRFQILPAEDGFFGVTLFDEPSIQVWERETNLCSAANWVLRRTVRLDIFLPLGLPELYMWSLRILGFDEEGNMIFLRTHDGIFMIHLESQKFRKVSDESNIGYIYPYSCF